jgi:hypothetical protein
MALLEKLIVAMMIEKFSARFTTVFIRAQNRILSYII